MRCSCLWLLVVMGWASFFVLSTTSVSCSGVVVHIVPPYFGEIDLHPKGDSITIAAQNGSAVPTSLYSVVTGGGSGRLMLKASGAEQVQVIYPDEVVLSGNGQTILLRGMPALSQTSAVLPGGNVVQELSIGGVLILDGNEKRGSYSGSIPIQVNFF